MNYALNQGLQSIHDSLREQIDAIAQEVKLTVIDKYWEQWKQKNQEISTGTYGGETFNPGKYPPNLVLIGSAKKEQLFGLIGDQLGKAREKIFLVAPLKKFFRLYKIQLQECG